MSSEPEEDVLYEEQVEPESGYLGLTLRELLIVGVWVIALVVSFFPSLGGVSVWQAGIHWVLSIGVPTLAVFLLVLRRFSPEGIRRVGSLGIDQFASVAFTVQAIVWLQIVWDLVVASAGGGRFVVGWVPVVELLAAIALVVLTVAAPLIAGLREDFHGRLETLAHRNANPVRPVLRRPSAPADALVAPPVAEDDAVGPSAAVEQGAADGAETTVLDRDQLIAGATEHVVDVIEVRDPADADGPTDADEFLTTEDLRSALGLMPVEDDDLREAETDEPSAEDPFDREQADGSGPVESRHAGTAQAEPHHAEPDQAEPDQVGAAQAESGYDEPGHEDLERTEADHAASSGAEPDSGAAEAGVPGIALSPADSHRIGAAMDEGTDGDDEDPLPMFLRNDRPDPAPEPFWFLVPEPRAVVDDSGAEVFRIGPHAWALAIEDRGGAYVVRDDDGRIGFLHDLSDIKKG
ncbi:MAG: hypothetical protein WA971_04750 [Microbacterium sp.]